MKNLVNKKMSYGTKEWSISTVNCCTGCSHDCRYCYARSMASRFKRVKPENWRNEQIRERDVYRVYRNYKGTVMFPSSHDITETNFTGCIQVLYKLLEAGNRVLIVSKPHYYCILAYAYFLVIIGIKFFLGSPSAQMIIRFCHFGSQEHLHMKKENNLWNTHLTMAFRLQSV